MFDGVSEPQNFSFEEAVQRRVAISYDALGRITQLTTPATAPENIGRDLMNVTRRYTETGDVRELVTDAIRIGAGLDPTGHQWFTYDAEGRMTMVDGDLVDNQIVLGDSGTAITYDALGRREGSTSSRGASACRARKAIPTTVSPLRSSTRRDQFRTERYSYDDLNRLTLVEQQVRQRHKTKEERSNPGEFEQMSDFDTGFLKFAEHHYDQNGRVFFDAQYEAIHFNGRNNSSATDYSADAHLAHPLELSCGRSVVRVSPRSRRASSMMP